MQNCMLNYTEIKIYELLCKYKQVMILNFKQKIKLFLIAIQIINN